MRISSLNNNWFKNIELVNKPWDYEQIFHQFVMDLCDGTQKFSLTYLKRILNSFVGRDHLNLNDTTITKTIEYKFVKT